MIDVLKKRRIFYNWAATCKVFFVSLTLAACSTPRPGIEIRTVEVPVEVMRPCLTEIPVRPERFDSGGETDARNLAALLTAKLLEWRQYGTEAGMALRRCAE